MADAILRRPEVRAITGLSNTTMYALISEGKFPKPVPLGARAVGFLKSEVDDWISSRVQARDSAQESKARR